MTTKTKIILAIVTLIILAATAFAFYKMGAKKERSSNKLPVKKSTDVKKEPENITPSATIIPA